MQTTLQGQRILLRPLQYSDADALLHAAAVGKQQRAWCREPGQRSNDGGDVPIQENRIGACIKLAERVLWRGVQEVERHAVVGLGNSPEAR